MTMKQQTIQKHAAWLMAGMLLALALVMLLAADHSDQVGRYRMALVNRRGFADIFVIDTTTGIVKYVGKDEGKPFEEIKGR